MNPDDYDQLVGAIYEAVHHPSEWSAVFTALSDVLKLDTYVLMCFVAGSDSAVPQLMTVGGTHVSDSAADRYNGYYAALDSRAELVRRHYGGQVFNCHRHFDSRYVERSEFYQDFLIPEGLRYTMGSSVRSSHGNEYVLGLMRGSDRKVFCDHDEAKLKRLIPHLGRALILMDEIQFQRRRAETSMQAMEATSMAVIGLNAAGQVLHSNRCAERLLREARVVRVRHGILACADSALDNRLNDALDQCRESPAPITLLLVDRQRPQDRYSLTLTRSATGGSTLIPSEWSGAYRGLLCLISPLNQKRMATAKQLMALFGLSRAEASLARAVASGQTLECYAQNADLAMSTVRTQLRAVLSKTNVSRQAELVRLIGQLPVAREPS